jgi:hypothetical protein
MTAPPLCRQLSMGSPKLPDLLALRGFWFLIDMLGIHWYEALNFAYA